MNITTTVRNVQPTMSSLDLFDMVNDARIQHGQSAIRRNDFHARMRDELEGEHYESFVVQNSNNTETEAYRLTKDQCLLVSLREAKSVRRTVVEKLKVLENGPYRIPQTMAEALRLAADQQEQIEVQQRELQEAAPKVAFADRVSVAHDAITMSEAAKTIGTGRTRLFAFLRHHGWVNRRNEPYQAKIEAGLMDVKVSQWEHPEQGLKESITALITGKGLIKLQLLWESSKGKAA